MVLLLSYRATFEVDKILYEDYVYIRSDDVYFSFFNM